MFSSQCEADITCIVVSMLSAIVLTDVPVFSFFSHNSILMLVPSRASETHTGILNVACHTLRRRSSESRGELLTLDIALMITPCPEVSRALEKRGG